MSIHIVKLRPKPDAKGPKDVTERYVDVSAKSVLSLFQNVETILGNKVEPEERYNLYWTLSHGQFRKRQSFESVEVVVFDIDKIMTEQIYAYHEPLEAALGVKLSDCIVVHSGNGIQVVLKLKNPITKRTWFKENKPFYKKWCDRINKSLEASGLPGEADTTVFEAARLLRLPFTENRKPIWNPHSEEANVKEAELIYCAQNVDFILDPSEIKKEVKEEKQTKLDKVQFGKPDHEYINQECLFMKHCLDNASDLDEPTWYAGLGVAAHYEDNDETVHAISKCHPDYTFEETTEKAEQARSAASARTCEDIASRWDGCQKCPHYLRVKSPLKLKSEGHIATEDGGFSTISEKGKVTRQYADLRKYFEKNTPYVTIAELKRVMVWKDNYYQTMPDLKLEAYAQDHFKPIVESNAEIQEFVRLTKRFNVVDLDWLKEAESTKGLINLANGVLNVEKEELLEHSPEYAFQYVLPYNYDKGATCPTWDKLMQNIFEGRQDKIDLVEEYLGFILMGGDYNPNVALILSGEGNNGKSTLLNAIRMVVGDDNVSDVPVKTMSQRFGCGGLEGKLVNICEEEGPDCFKDTSNFKKATGDTKINIERKFEDGYSMLNRAKLILSFNETPHLFDTTEGMQRRLMIVPFNVDLKRSPEKMIEGIKDKLRAERSGILNRGLEGLKRLQANGFTKLKENGSIIRELVHDSDPVQYFFDEYCVIQEDLGQDMSVKELFTYFQDEMEAGKEQYKISERGFTKKLKKVAKRRGVEIERMKIEGKSMLGIKNITYINQEGVNPHESY